MEMCFKEHRASLFFVLFFVGVSGCATAGVPRLSVGDISEDEKRAMVMELLELNDARATVEKFNDGLIEIWAAVKVQLELTPGEEPLFQEFVKECATYVQDNVSWEQFRGPLADVYLRKFTAEDIHNMLVYSRSETGKKSIALMPEILEESMSIGDRIGEESVQGLKPIFDRFKAQVDAGRAGTESTEEGDAN